ncbi:MAG: sulfotransferase [Chloroflexota bacterium]
MQAQQRSTPAPPPTPPDGWQVGAPDYVGVGTARSGTTWWDQLIVSHPDVKRMPSTPKEVHFFDAFWQRELDQADIARYHAYFARPEGKISGEWTPGYMLDAWTPAALRQAAPEARLLVLLRDPVERFRSGRTLAENRFTVGSTARAAANAAFNRGLYADQLLRLWSAFPRERTLVLQYESCVADTRAQLLRTFDFLGLEPEAADPDLARRFNASPGPKVVLDSWQEDVLARRYAPENERLAILVPELDLSMWRAPS